jgi:MFS transporter, DHA2 family, methylenomycin A resistance protein
MSLDEARPEQAVPPGSPTPEPPAPDSPAPESPTTAGRGAWLTLAVMSAGLFLAVLSTTVVSVALPTIGRDLHASATDLEWIVDAYVIVYASLLVAGGVLGDRFGRKGLFMLGTAIFGAGALIAGLAPTVGVLLAGRVIQGAGPALLVPGSLTILRATFEDGRQRALAIGLWSTASGLALALGPAAGGLLVDGLGWSWVFLVNVPLALVLVLLAGRFVPRLPRSQDRGRFDGAGAALVTFALAALAFATIEGQTRGWAAPLVLGAFAAGALALTGFPLLERHLAGRHLAGQRQAGQRQAGQRQAGRRPTAPLIDVSLFARPAFTAANAAAVVVFFAFVGVLVYLSAFFQQVQGRSAVQAGLDVAAIGISYALAATWSGRLTGRFGERWPLLAGLVIAGVATLGLLRLEPGTPMTAIWWNFAILGAGIGLCGTPISAIAMSAVDASRAGMASAIVNSLRQVGQVFGVAVLGAIVYARLPGGPAGGRLTAGEGLVFTSGLHQALAVCGAALLAAAALAAVLLRHRSRDA